MSDLRSLARGLSGALRRDRTSLLAAGVGFHWFLAVFPFLFAAIATLTLVARSAQAEQTVTTAIQTIVPAGADRILMQIVDDARGAASQQGITSIVVAIVLALGGASAGMAALIQGLDAEADHDRSLLARRLLGLAFVLATFIVAGGCVAAGVGLGMLADAATWIPAGFVFVARCLVALAGALVVLGALYRYGRGRGRRWSWVTAGSVIAAGMILAASIGLALFVTHFGGTYARTYGSLASVVILLLWQYVVAFSVLFGAELNRELARSSVSVPGAPGRSTVTPKEAVR